MKNFEALPASAMENEPAPGLGSIKDTMDALVAERKRFRDVLDVLPVYVVLLTPDYRVPFANQVFLRRFGDAKGRRCFEHLFGRSEPCEVCDTYKVLQTMTPHQWEWVGPDGCTYSVFDFPFTDTDGATLILEMGIDITDRKKAETELAQHRTQLEELVKSRTRELEASNRKLQEEIAERKRAEKALEAAQADLRAHAEDLEKTVARRTAKLQEAVAELEHFSYAITHDMRAPLRAMQGFAAVVEEECLACNRGSQQYFKRIKIASSRMDQLITDSLNYTKAVRQEFALEVVDLADLLNGLVETYPNLQPDKADITIQPGLPCVLGNVAALTQCFSNLLGNAVKFARADVKPRVCVRFEPANPPQRTTGDPSLRSGSAEGQSPVCGPKPMVRIWVEDNGIGIPAAAMHRIFGIFQRLSNDQEGTGIGLAIVRKVVQRMGGAVGVESEEGKGSRFWVELQAAPGNGITASGESPGGRTE